MDNFYLQLEKEWYASLPRLSTHELAEVFPEAIPIWRKSVKNQIDSIKTILEKASRRRRELNNIIALHSLPAHKWYWEMVAEFIYLPDVQALNKKLKRLSFLYNSLSIRKPHALTSGVSAEQIQQARETPLEQLYTGNLRASGAQLYGLCPLHDDKKPSFSISPSKNLWYCHVCCTGGDSITFVMLTQGKTFPEAIRLILHI